MLRHALELDKQDLHRFENDPQTNAESIVTVKRIIKEKEATIALFPPD